MALAARWSLLVLPFLIRSSSVGETGALKIFSFRLPLRSVIEPTPH
jgi:hypothetical protein